VKRLATMTAARENVAGLGREALDRVDDAVLITDGRTESPGPRIVYANRAFREMTGYPADELLGRTPAVLQGPETRAADVERVDRALAAGQAYRGEMTGRRRNGEALPLHWRIEPVRDGDGRLSHFIAVARDVTLERRYERRLNELEVLVRVQREVAAGGLDLDTVRQRVVRAALEVSGADGAAIEEPDGDEMVYRAVAGKAAGHAGTRLPIDGSLSGTCYRELRSIFCDDTAEDARAAVQATRAVGFRSGVLVPLCRGYRCFGVLKVYAQAPGRFSAVEQHLLELASGVLAASLESAHTYHAEVDRRERLIDALPMLIAYVDRDGRYREINAASERWFGLARAQLVGREMRDALGEHGYAAIEPYVNAALRGESVHFQTQTTFRSGDEHYLEGDYIPDLDGRGRVRGFYAAVRDVTGLQTLYTDYLTRLSNRRRLEEQGAILIEAARRYGRPLSLVMIDVDYFKSINDALGHLAGDGVLMELARVLEGEVRAADVLARWGGEEFVVLAPETTEAEAAAFAERIRARVAEHGFAPAESVTLSIGLAELAGPEEDMASLYERADRALYRAKRAGRNRVIRHGAAIRRGSGSAW